MIKISLFVLLSVSAVRLWAGTGAVSPDGTFLARSEGKAVMIKNLETFTETELPLPKHFAVELPCLAATRDRLLVGGSHALMAWDPQTREWSRLFTLAKNQTLEDIAVNPWTGFILLAIAGPEKEISWWVLKPGQETLCHVFNRRADGASDPVFDPGGALYFCHDGDVWKGSIDPDEGGGNPGFVLSGHRIWPVADMETYGGTSSGCSAHAILPLPAHLIVARTRSRGSGWGSIIRVPNKDAFKEQLPLKWDELEDCESSSDPALSWDGKKAFIYIHSNKRWSEVDVETGDLTPLPNH